MTRGLVKASASQMTSGYEARSEAISHSQKRSGLVCGLSTRKIRTPWLIQNSLTSRSSFQSCRQSGVEKSSG